MWRAVARSCCARGGSAAAAAAVDKQTRGRLPRRSIARLSCGHESRLKTRNSARVTMAIHTPASSQTGRRPGASTRAGPGDPCSATGTAKLVFVDGLVTQRTAASSAGARDVHARPDVHRLDAARLREPDRLRLALRLLCCRHHVRLPPCRTVVAPRSTSLSRLTAVLQL